MAATKGDPGWGHALRTGRRELLVPLPFMPGAKPGRDSLTALRVVFLQAISAMWLVIVVTRFVSLGGSGDDAPVSRGAFLALIAVYGVLDIVVLVLALRKAPDPGVDADGVAGWFRAVTFLRAGMSVDLVSTLLSSPFRPGAASETGTRSGAGTGTPPRS